MFAVPAAVENDLVCADGRLDGLNHLARFIAAEGKHHLICADRGAGDGWQRETGDIRAVILLDGCAAGQFAQHIAAERDAVFGKSRHESVFQPEIHYQIVASCGGKLCIGCNLFTAAL